MDQVHPEENLFHHIHNQMGDRSEEIDRIVEEGKSRKENVFDSHPSLGTRIDNLPEVDRDKPSEPSMDRIFQELNPLLDDLSARCLPSSDDADEF